MKTYSYHYYISCTNKQPPLFESHLEGIVALKVKILCSRSLSTARESLEHHHCVKNIKFKSLTFMGEF
jgi:hypothetical protein